MRMANRNGKRKTRHQLSKRRSPELGNYLIVTDTKETEKNYMNGLRDSIPEELQRKLVIRVCKTKTTKLVDEAQNLASMESQYAEPWIIFDRDRVENFDLIIRDAEQKGIKAGWSNPCIEIWFSAYFGLMPLYQDSASCCNGFAREYLQITGKEYVKSDEDIYSNLCRYGNEERAIKIVTKKCEEHKRNCNEKPSEMCPCTQVHLLVKEIKEKIAKNK